MKLTLEGFETLSITHRMAGNIYHLVTRRFNGGKLWTTIHHIYLLCETSASALLDVMLLKRR